MDPRNPEDRKPSVAGWDRDLSGSTRCEAEIRWRGSIQKKNPPRFRFPNENRYAGPAVLRRGQAQRLFGGFRITSVDFAERIPRLREHRGANDNPTTGHRPEIKDDGFGTKGVSLRRGGGGEDESFPDVVTECRAIGRRTRVESFTTR